ncbi:MAG: hypothetical protein KZQ94_21035 [Candidatus Thiodiazotropha sp. (ex Troendleina suluensis)]|nr:hypothetical protein [Candidatus Thiodiazotropha sp. (ex Troendleina suluensis)]
MSIGTFSTIGLWLREETLWERIIDKSTHLRNVNRQDFYRLAIQMAISAVAYHEVAHIVRGHNGYIYAGKLISDEIEIARRKICEVDADKWCSFLLGGDILQNAKHLSLALYNTEKIYPHVAKELFEVLSVGLYRYLAVYNHPESRPSTLYPHPLIRTMRIAIGASDNLETNQLVPSDALNRLTSVLNGLIIAEEYIEGPYGFLQRNWDLGEELMNFEKKYEKQLEELHKELIPFVPK